MLIEQKTYPFNMPVNWQDPTSVKGLSSSMQDWLLNTGSLTERLQALTNHFSVNLLGQKLLTPDKAEQNILAETERQNWQIREVILQGIPFSDTQIDSTEKPQDWVFARSVLPDLLCKSQFVNLGNQPLGKRIFNDNQFVRSNFQIGELEYHPITGNAIDNKTRLWARRSKFTVQNFELIVAEAFLPSCPCYWS